jgi:hypothetical protein
MRILWPYLRGILCIDLVLRVMKRELRFRSVLS